MHRADANRGSRIACVLAAVVMLAACGGEQVAGIQGSGQPVATTAVGPITGFGSIFVNGVEYSTSGAQIRVNDQAASEAQLRVGQIVTVKGTVNEDGVTGSATEVHFSGDVQGAVSQLDVAARTFVVLGQTVRVTDATLFDENIQPAGIEGLQGGADVEVSGFASDDGQLVASRIDLKPAGNSKQVKGKVQALDTAARTFRINALVVDYSGAAPAGGTLANGSSVKVVGTSSPGDGTLSATSVTVSEGPAGAANQRGELEGLITTFTSTSDFVVNGQRVSTDSSTQIVPAGLALGPNVFVKVRGTYSGSGVLVADKVEAKVESSSTVQGVVDAVSTSGGTLTILGVTVSTSAATSFEDKSEQHERSFDLADVRTGDYLKVRGAPASGGGVIAAIVERERPQNEAILQGVAGNVSDPNFTLLGVTVMVTDQTQFTGGGQSPRERFFDEAPGKLVKVRGAMAGSIFTADQVQIVR